MNESFIENWKPMRVVQVLLSADFQVVGMNEQGQQLYGPVLKGLGGDLFDYHSGKSRNKVATLLQELAAAPSDMPRTIVIDVLGKALMFNMSRLTVIYPCPQTLWSGSIYCVQSDGDYRKIHTPGKSYCLHSSLRNLLRRYTGAGFFRVHKEFVVNLAHVRRLALDENGHTRIAFDDAAAPCVRVSRRRVAELKKAMHIA